MTRRLLDDAEWNADRTFIDRELYLPKVGTADRDRCAQAGIGAEAEFATKPELAPPR